MSPTAELRLVRRLVPLKFDRGHAYADVLQQKWVQHHIPAGETQAPFEWRDVPLVGEVPHG